MTFQELLNDYLTQLECTARELSAASGISAPVISRYRSGSHSPDLDGEQWQKLASGIAALAAKRGLEGITQAAVESAFRDALTLRESFDKEHFRHNLNKLLDAFSIGNMELARYLSFDASYLSRIRSGQRTPPGYCRLCTERGAVSCPALPEQRGAGTACGFDRSQPVRRCAK
ncbi:MAG: hypothetical protein ACI3XG_06255 [Faecousia sp.]